MKSIKSGIWTSLVIILLATPNLFAIEGLKLQIHCPHVFLSWPSTNGETYLVQYRATLDTNDNWLTLTNFMPPASGTNLTVFVHSNRVDCPTGQVFGMMRSGGGSGSSSASEQKDSKPTEPMVLSKDGSRAPVPLEIYPPGFDLSGHLIIWPDGSSDEWSKELGEKYKASREDERGGPQPADAGDGSEPATGFYRVVRNGLHLGGVQNGMVLSGTVDFPYELEALANIGTPAIRLFANGISLPMATSETDSAGRRLLRWNTAFALNGSYDIYAKCDFSDEWIFSTTNSVVISNLVHFEEFTTDFGGQMWVYAELAIPEAEVLIDVYTEDDFVGTFGDYTTDGVISFLWDLKDPNGVLLTNETFHGVFHVTPASSITSSFQSSAANLDSGSEPPFKPLTWHSQNAGGIGPLGPTPSDAITNPPPWMTNAAHIKWNKQYGWLGDDFVVAWGITPIFGPANRTDGMIQRGVVDILASPVADYPYTLSPGNTWNGTTYRLNSANKTNLLYYLSQPNYRNFFFYGHGNSTRIGDFNSFAGWIVTIDEDEIRTALGNLVGQGDKHPYRFVFLNTCNSAAGSLCDTFGIIKGTYHRNIFRNNDIKARAFVGFLESYLIPSGATQVSYCEAMLGQFCQEWRDGMTINGVVARAKQNAYWPLDPSATIYGADNLYRFYPY